MREVMRLKHCSIRTERTYCGWVRRYIHFHQMRAREQVLPAEPKIEGFLSELAVKGNVAVSTQNQAFNALLFAYWKVLRVPGSLPCHYPQRLRLNSTFSDSCKSNFRAPAGKFRQRRDVYSNRAIERPASSGVSFFLVAEARSVRPSSFQGCRS